MRDIKNKYVLVDNKLIGARVVFHREIHPSPRGGGWWYYDRETNKLILYGTSFDFGSITKEQAMNAELGGSFRSLKDAEIIFDGRDNYDVLKILSDHLGEDRAMDIVTECDFI